MKKLSLLSSVFVMSMLSFGAYAALGDDVIEGGPNTCTVDVLGVTEHDDTAYAIATWDLVKYNCEPGTTVMLDEETGEYECMKCPENTYCPGGENLTIEDNIQPGTCPADYPNADAPADSIYDCYVACDVNNAGIEHATSVTGKKYYGNNNECLLLECGEGYTVNTTTNTCEIAACPIGQHKELVATVKMKSPIVPIDSDTSAGGYARLDGTELYYSDLGIDQKESGLTELNTWVHMFSEGKVYGRASCQASVSQIREYLNSTSGTQNDPNMLNRLLDGGITMDQFRTEFEPVAGKDKTDFVETVLNRYEKGQIDKTEAYFQLYSVFYSDNNANYETDSSGQYCYCQITGFIPNAGTKEEISGAPWVLHEVKFDSDNQCQESCSDYCAHYSVDDHPERRGFIWALLGMSDGMGSIAECRANIIKIDWNPDNNGAHTLNTCVYGGDVTLPDDPKKAGYVFTGWKIDTSKSSSATTE